MAKTLNFTNPSQHGRTGLMRSIVPFALGEVASEAALQDWTVNWRGADVPTYWSAFGAPHRDGSVRWAVAEFRQTIPGDGQAQSPTVVAEVVNRANVSPPATSFPLQNVFDALGLTVSYTDPENGQSYSADILANARAGTNNATLTTENVGGRRYVRAEAYMGRGTHYETARANGWNTNSALVTTQGNLHVRTWWEFGAGDEIGHMTILFLNDAAYPTPSVPPNGTGNTQAQSRPATLDDPLVRHIQDLRLTFTDPSNTLHFRSWWTDNWNENSGRGIMGPFGAVAGTNFETWAVPITGLMDIQAWGVKFSFARSAGQAEVLARLPFAFQGMPTQECWIEATRQGSLPGSWSDHEISIAGWEAPLRAQSQADLDAWYRRGPSVQNGVMSGSRYPGSSSDPWHLLGAKQSVQGGSTGRNYGGLQEGAIMLAGSIWELYERAGTQLRESCARYSWIWGFENQPRLLSPGPIGSGDSAWWKGGSIRQESRNGYGRFSGPPGPRAVRPLYNGVEASSENPDARGRWEQWDAEHHGIRPLFQLALWTQDRAYMDLVYENAYAQCIWFCEPGLNSGGYANAGAAGETFRSGFRTLQIVYYGWWIWNDATFEECVYRRVNQWFDGPESWHANARPAPSWLRTIGAIQPTKGTFYQCDASPNLRYPGNPVFDAWQVAQGSVFYLSVAFDFASINTTAAERLIDLIYVWAQVHVEHSCMIGPGLVPPESVRLLDACWNSSRITFRRQQGDIVDWAYCRGVLAQDYVGDNGTFLGLKEKMTDLIFSPSTTNGGENVNNNWMNYIWEIFSALQADTGFALRANYMRDAVHRQYASLTLGPQGYESQNGFAIGSYLVDTSSPPVAYFSGSPTQGASPLTVSFDASASAIPSGVRADAIVRWWFAYNGNSSSSPDLQGTLGSGAILTPQHTYQGGTYTARLQVEDSLGEVSTYERTNYIDVTGVTAPVADFTANPTSGYAPLEVQFTDLSTGGTPTSWLWDFGDGNSSTERHPRWIYGEGGTYTVSLMVENSAGADTQVRQDYINVTAMPLVPPVADFDASPTFGEVPLAVTFTDLSSNTISPSYTWTFGDGGSSAEASPSHTYTELGTYDVLLRVDDVGGTSFATGVIYVTEASVSVAFSVPAPEHLVATSWPPTLGLGVTVTPSAQNLRLRLHAPYAILNSSHVDPVPVEQGHVLYTPTTLDLSAATPAPSIATGATVSPSAEAMAFALLDPSVTTTTGQSVTVTAQPVNLALGMKAPSVATGVQVTPNADGSTLLLAILDPGVSTTNSADVTFQAQAMILGLAMPTPTIRVDVTATPSAESIASATLAPSVSGSHEISVEVRPSPIALVSATRDSVSVSVGVTTTADLLGLAFAMPMATISTTRVEPRNVYVTPSPIAVAWALLTPTVSGTSTYTAPLEEVFLGALAPTVGTDANVTVEPNRIASFLNVMAPLVTGTEGVTVTPDPETLVFDVLSPTVETMQNVNFVPAAQPLTFAMPSASIFGGTASNPLAPVMGLAFAVLTPEVFANVTSTTRIIDLKASWQQIIDLDAEI